MKNKGIIVIDDYELGHDLISMNFEELGIKEKDISFVTDYSQAEKKLKELDSENKEYIVLSDVTIKGTCTSKLLKKVIESGNIVILHSARMNLGKNLTELIEKENLHYVLKSNKHLGEGEEFYKEVLKPVGLEKIKY